MKQKHILIVAPFLLLLLLAGAWAGFRPEGSPLLPIIGSSDGKSSHEIGAGPLIQPPPDIDEEPLIVPDNPDANSEDADLLAGIDETERERIKAAHEQARIEAREQAETQAAESTDPTGQPQPGKPPAADNRTPEQKALDAERQRRIDALKAIKRPPNQSLGNVRPHTRKLKNEAGKKELGEISPKLLQDRRGLFAKYYAFNELPLSAIIDPNQPELDDRTPDVTRIDPQVYFPSKDAWADLPFDKTNFMGVWAGFLVIKETADYWLYLGADYTGVVTLDGESVLYNDMRDYTEVSTVLTLTAGLHPIRIDYMEGKNGSPVDPLAACNFMYVPEGQSKPIPVPPEMLMLPEELWSDSAPIITKLSKYSGEIGDEITISGQNLDGDTTPAVSVKLGDIPSLPPYIRVQIAGQYAAILDHSDTSLTVRIPVGATTGKVIVFKATAAGGGGSFGSIQPEYSNAVPSNSMDFTITTQFGLFASWHNLAGWSNYDFVDESVHAPDIVRLEREYMFDTRDDLDLTFRNNPLACHWEGKLGIPAGWVAEGKIALVRFQTYGRLRVTLGGELKETTAQTGGTLDLTTLDFEIRDSSEHYLPLSIDWTSESGAAGLKVVKMIQNGVLIDGVGDEATFEPKWEQVETLQSQLFFPPVVPPKPPVILSAKPIYEEGQQPPVLPYDVRTTLPSIREGQLFEITLKVFSDVSLESIQGISLTIDGIPLPWSLPEETMEVIRGKDGGSIFSIRATLPSGLGEGRIVARQTVVTSEPFYIDVQNKGLIAYLYDLPNPGGYTKMPDPEPLTCFEVRKMPWVNYENANQFDLPFPAETFAIEWFGALIIETEGDYRFTCRSDDGILVWLDDHLVLADDNLHYQREKTGDWVHLVPGTYNFRMQFFENNVHEVCVLQWDARTDRDDDQSEFIQRGIIGKRHFTWDQHPALPQKTSTHKRADGSDPE